MEDAERIGLDLSKPFASDHASLMYTHYPPRDDLNSLIKTYKDPNEYLTHAPSQHSSLPSGLQTYSVPNSPRRSPSAIHKPSLPINDHDALFIPASKHVPHHDLDKPTVSDLDILEHAERTPTSLYTREDRYSRPRSRPLSLLSTSTSTSTNSDAFYQDRVYTKSHNRGLSLRSSFSLLPEPHTANMSGCCPCLHCGSCPQCAQCMQYTYQPVQPNYATHFQPSHSHNHSCPNHTNSNVQTGHQRSQSLADKLDLSFKPEEGHKHTRSGSTDLYYAHMSPRVDTRFEHDISPDIQSPLSPPSPSGSESNVQNVFRTLAYKERQVLQARQNLMDAVQELETFRTQLSSTLQPELNSTKLDYEPKLSTEYGFETRPKVRIIPNTSLQTGVHAWRCRAGLAITALTSDLSSKTVYRIDGNELLVNELSKLGPFIESGRVAIRKKSTSVEKNESAFLMTIKFLLRAVHGVFSVIPGYRPDNEFISKLVFIPYCINPTEVLFDLFLYHGALKPISNNAN